jgi:antitoxin (DNA-binding transcriptional repressor) of toxin-antitoxin stability system
MAIHNSFIGISVTQFRASCLDLICRVDSGDDPVDIKRRGNVVARLAPPPSARLAVFELRTLLTEAVQPRSSGGS